MEVVNFRVGNRLVAFNILNILLTEKFDDQQTSVPTEDASFLGIKDFMGVPTPIYDLGIAMNKKSTKKQNYDLIEQLHQLQATNNEFLSYLEKNLNSGNKLDILINNHKNDFSLWYSNFKTENSDLADVLAKMTAPLNHLYDLPSRLANLQNNNQTDEAIKIINIEKNATLASINRLYEAACEQISASYKPVTVFTTTDGRQPSLGFVIDKVEDSLHVEQEQIRPLKDLSVHTGNIDVRVKNMITGLLTTSNKNSLLLKPEAFL